MLVRDDSDDPPDGSQQASEQRTSDPDETQVPGIIEDPDGPTPSVTPPPPPPDQDGGENPASQVRLGASGGGGSVAVLPWEIRDEGA